MRKFLVVLMIGALVWVGGCAAGMSAGERAAALTEAKSDYAQALRACYMGQGSARQVEKLIQRVQRLERQQI